MLENRGSVWRHAPAAVGTTLLVAAAVVGTQMALSGAGHPRAPLSPYTDGGFTVGVAAVDRRVSITAADDGSYVLGYTPAGGDVVLDLDLLSGDTVQPWWYDPETGRTLRMRTLGSEGVARFPVPKQGGGPAWVLVVDDVAAGYGPPDPDVVEQATGSGGSSSGASGTPASTGGSGSAGGTASGDAGQGGSTGSGTGGSGGSAGSGSGGSGSAGTGSTGSGSDGSGSSTGTGSNGTSNAGNGSGGETGSGGDGADTGGSGQDAAGQDGSAGEKEPADKDGSSGGEGDTGAGDKETGDKGAAGESGGAKAVQPGADPASGSSPEKGRFGSDQAGKDQQKPANSQKDQPAPEPVKVEKKANPAPAPQKAAADASWDKLAKCESSGDWAVNTGNGYYGGLQFDSATWSDFGGTQYAPRADKASKEQQIEIASKVRDARGGYSSWPACSSKLGLPK